MINQGLALISSIFTLGLLTTALMPGSTQRHTAQKAFASGYHSESPADGVWVGRWKAEGDSGEGKSLMCETTQTGSDSWTATFNAVCDADYSFTMDMPGRCVGDELQFEVTVDLGADYGGEYHWTGKVVGKEFNGEYTNPHYNGTFHMAKSTDAVIASGVYCEVKQPVEPTAKDAAPDE